MPTSRFGIETGLALEHAALHWASITPYEGRQVTGKPSRSLLRGVGHLGRKARGQPGLALRRAAPPIRQCREKTRRETTPWLDIEHRGHQTGPIQQRHAPRPSDGWSIFSSRRRPAGAELAVFPEMALTTFFPRWRIDYPREIESFFETSMPG